jgi:hypothetical protein
MYRVVNGYRGAQPYFTVSYRHKGDRREGRSRFTPFRVRAEWLYDQMAKDITDPAVLGLGPRA